VATHFYKAIGASNKDEFKRLRTLTFEFGLFQFGDDSLRPGVVVECCPSNIKKQRYIRLSEKGLSLARGDNTTIPMASLHVNTDARGSDGDGDHICSFLQCVWTDDGSWKDNCDVATCFYKLGLDKDAFKTARGVATTNMFIICGRLSLKTSGHPIQPVHGSYNKNDYSTQMFLKLSAEGLNFLRAKSPHDRRISPQGQPTFPPICQPG